MPDDRPATGEHLNPQGAVTVPRQAATIMLLRGGDATLELLLVQRNLEARFMPGAWVFPGGAVDAGEGEGDEAHRLAAVRELGEEAGVFGIDPAGLVKYSRWITPPEVRIRFDTHFFLASAPADVAPEVDGQEAIAFRWVTPQGALAAQAAGELHLVYPTIKQMEQLSAFASAEALLEHARGRDVEPVEPRILGTGEQARVVLPGDPGYEDPAG